MSLDYKMHIPLRSIIFDDNGELFTKVEVKGINHVKACIWK